MSGINYPKEFIKPDGRKLRSGGPRDLQRRQGIIQNNELNIDELEKQFDNLKKELKKPQQQPEGFFSPEQVDEEIRKAVEQAVTETIASINNPDYNKHQTEVDELKKEIANLKQNLLGKEEVINVLKSRPMITNDVVEDSDRPQMEQQFIDPLEKDAGKGLKSYIDITDTKTTDKDNMFEKVDKLKNLLGDKLPKGSD
jgi:predicted RNase H-like nuclease (RuvC/YqgF family)